MVLGLPGPPLPFPLSCLCGGVPKVLHYKLFHFKCQSSPWALAVTACVLGSEGR